MSGKKYAYRLVYEAAFGRPCPEGIAHHTCEDPSCVNPLHLEFISQADHLREHSLVGDNHQGLKTHCPQGHPYDSENTVYVKGRSGRERVCRICRREAGRRWRAKQAENMGW